MKGKSCFVEPWPIGRYLCTKIPAPQARVCQVPQGRRINALSPGRGGGGERERERESAFLGWMSPSELLRLDYLWGHQHKKRAEEGRAGTSWEHHLTCQVTQGDSSRGKIGTRASCFPGHFFRHPLRSHPNSLISLSLLCPPYYW